MILYQVTTPIVIASVADRTFHRTTTRVMLIANNSDNTNNINHTIIDAEEEDEKVTQPVSPEKFYRDPPDIPEDDLTVKGKGNEDFITSPQQSELGGEPDTTTNSSLPREFMYKPRSTTCNLCHQKPVSCRTLLLNTPAVESITKYRKISELEEAVSIQYSLKIGLGFVGKERAIAVLVGMQNFHQTTLLEPKSYLTHKEHTDTSTLMYPKQKKYGII